MRWLISFLLFGLLAAVQAASSSGNKLLVVLEELADKTKYSKYVKDLEGLYFCFWFNNEFLGVNTIITSGRGFNLTYESPKSESISLFHLGARAYDHLLILPAKSKGINKYTRPGNDIQANL
jgi:oligosaccharyltransferase complex subunit beta